MTGPASMKDVLAQLDVCPPPTVSGDATTSEEQLEAGLGRGAALGEQSTGVVPSHETTVVRKPTHYRMVTISMYTRDIDALTARIKALKLKGFSKANRSLLIRIALDKLSDADVEAALDHDIT